MRLDPAEVLRRLTEHDHGVLATTHPQRGADAVPVTYALVDGVVGIAIDTVKPKAPGKLQRERNLEADPRATLLAEGWDAGDWSQLWWVRAALRWRAHPDDAAVEELAAALVGRYGPYRDRPFSRVLVFDVLEVTGWAASGEPPTPRRSPSA